MTHPEPLSVFVRVKPLLLLVAAATQVVGSAGAAPCPDADGDGWADCSVAGCDTSGLTCGDCDDGQEAVHPGAAESCNHRDDDCDGLADEDSPEAGTERKVLSPRPADPFFARALRITDDADGDGIPDIVVGFHGDATLGGWEGGLVLVSGADMSVLCHVHNDTPVGGGQLGIQLDVVGDLDGDGRSDFAGSAPFSDRQAYDAGEIVLFSGDVASGCPRLRHFTDPDGAGSDRLGDENGLSGWLDATGDGVAEVLAGARYADPGGVRDAGHGLVFDGATGAKLWTLTDAAAEPDDNLGTSIAGLGDVTGDGTPDIAVGAPRRDGALADQGAVLVFSGADGSYHGAYRDPGAQAHAWFGYAVDGIDDLDGDATPDLVGGAIYHDSPAAVDAGEVVALSGADGALIWRAHDADGRYRDHLGWFVRAIADVSGDDIPDVLAGAPYADDDVASDAGRVLVLSGADGSVLRRLTPADVAAEDLAGFSADAAADLNGDGGPEFVVSVSHDNVPKYGADRGSFVVLSTESDCDGDGHGPWGGDCDDGRADVHPGHAELCDGIDNDCDAIVDEDEDGDGYDVCGESDCGDAAGANDDPTVFPGATELCDGKDNDCDGSVDEGPDADGDGHFWPCDCDDADDAVHPGATDVCNHVADGCGAVDAGATERHVEVELADRDPIAGDLFGTAVASIGDVDADGFPDFAIGAPSDDSVSWNKGQVTLYSGRVRRVLCRTRTAGFADLGRTVTGAGDLDGDGIPDVAAGAPAADQVVLISGADCGVIASCQDPYPAVDRIGAEHGLGRWIDRNGDGVDEILAAAPGSNQHQHHGGLALVFSYDRVADSCEVLFELVDPNLRPYDNFGFSIAGVGDVTGDGTADIVVGVPNDSSLTDAGGAAVVFSGADGSFVERLLDPDGGWRDRLGYSVAGSEDLDGDGWPEILAGVEFGDTPAGGDAGRILVFSGRERTVVRRLYDPDGAPGDRLGHSLAVVDDHDGDGLPDVLTGARWADVGGVVDAGRAVLLSTGAEGVRIASFDNPAPAASTYFGETVGTAGDLSGDGLPELLAGTPWADGDAGNDTGIVWLLGRESDCDDDGAGPWGGDCDDQDADLWRLPSEVRSVWLHEDKRTMTWGAPADPGQASGTLLYDVIRSDTADDFETAGVCEVTDTPGTTADLPAEPSPGAFHFHLVRAANGCGEGDLGDQGAEAWPRTARACP
jgi:hypothetical protein